MSQWTHPQCASCFRGEQPYREPVLVREPYREYEICCWCGNPTEDGIYNREDPALLPNHQAHVDD